jgi:NHLM bacteriocin system ABC transporter ATP-binding protein
MSDDPSSEGVQDAPSSEVSAGVKLDPRHPRLLDDREHVLQVKAGYVDIFAVAADMSRRHLFRVGADEIILDLHTAAAGGAGALQIVAVGGPGAELVSLSRADTLPADGLARWISHLARLVIPPGLPGSMPELVPGEPRVMQPKEKCRGTMRAIAWTRVTTGTATFLGQEPALAPRQPVPLVAGLWIEAGEAGCTVRTDAKPPEASLLWPAVDRVQLAIITRVAAGFERMAGEDVQRLSQRTELTQTQTIDALQSLAETVVGESVLGAAELLPADPLLSCCRIVGATLGASVSASSRPASGHPFRDALEIARAARLRVRKVQLREQWWTLDVGPLVAWRGEGRDPVALIRNHQGGYNMIDPRRETRGVAVTRALAAELAPDAVAFYPALPSRGLGYRDLFALSVKGLGSSIARIVALVLAIGLLGLVPPLFTNFLVNSVIPRTEIDQLIVCALALVVTAVAAASLQATEGMVMLRLEGLVDFKLQASLIDRLLRLPAGLFREYTTGDLVDRAMGVDAIRRILTGRTLRGFMSLLYCVFSVGLMFYYDLKLGAVALLLTLLRAVVIIANSAIRVYYENRHFNLQGKTSGLVLQMIAGVGKLRVANASARALALWSRRFATQKNYFIASQRVANVLGVFETTYPTIATMVIFGLAAYTDSGLLKDVGAFLGFNTAFGQTMGSIGAWASSVSESLVAIPHLTRLKPLITPAAEISDDLRPPGDLTGEVELSGVTFRYAQGGAPVLDDITLKIAPGEYVAVVGPSGSGKSSLLRLILGFERPETGAVFFDGKALNTLDTSALRRQLGVVLQDSKLATGSIYENICGGIEMPLDHAWAAAQLAAVDTDIKAMPMGMHTLVAEGINTLSGGQRQRIMIARAIARLPRILLFDEATSALDNQTQAIVATSLQRFAVTRVVIAHRLSTIRQADRIVMLTAGKIVQMGSFQELIDQPGPFSDFARRQLLQAG